MNYDTLFTQTHIEMVGMIIVPTFLFWLDRRRADKASRQQAEQHMQEERQRADERHQQNLERLIRIETMVVPMWETWKVNGDSK